MKRTLFTISFAVIGLIIPLLVGALANQLHVVPQFPALGGDDDFNLRAAVFFLLVEPAFAGVGGWIGYAWAPDVSAAARAWLGVIGGSIVAFVIVRACAHWIENIASRNTANVSAIAFLAAWPALAVAGAWLSTHPLRAREKRRLGDG